MNHSEMIAAIARRLPQRTRREVAEVLEVMEELWLEELISPDGFVTVGTLGKITVDVHSVRSAGAVRKTMLAHGVRASVLHRVVVRFRASSWLRSILLQAYEEGE